MKKSKNHKLYPNFPSSKKEFIKALQNDDEFQGLIKYDPLEHIPDNYGIKTKLYALIKEEANKLGWIVKPNKHKK